MFNRIYFLLLLLTARIAFADSQVTCGSILTGMVPLFRYKNFSSGHHFYTTNANEIGTTTPGAAGNGGLISQGIAGYVFPVQSPDTQPLFRYLNLNNSNHFYTIDANEIGTTTKGVIGRDGITISEGIAAYVYPFARSQMVPLYRYFHRNNVSHFYTTDASEIGTITPGVTGNDGYMFEIIACYLSPTCSDPSSRPTAAPSFRPTEAPSSRPTATPSSRPAEAPSSHPSTVPSFRPTIAPSSGPTSSPTATPSFSSSEGDVSE